MSFFTDGFLEKEMLNYEKETQAKPTNGYDGSGINPKGIYNANQPFDMPVSGLPPYLKSEAIKDAKAYYESLSSESKKFYDRFKGGGENYLQNIYAYLAQNKAISGSYEGMKANLTTITNQGNCSCKQPLWHFGAVIIIGGLVGYFIAKN